jgi:hypothetical protein
MFQGLKTHLTTTFVETNLMHLLFLHAHTIYSKIMKFCEIETWT